MENLGKNNLKILILGLGLEYARFQRWKKGYISDLTKTGIQTILINKRRKIEEIRKLRFQSSL